MESIKITINGKNRVVVIPLTYDDTTDTAELNEIQIEPMPEEKEDISKDIVMMLSKMILNVLKNA